MTEGALKLRFVDEDDLKVAATMLQDAIIPAADMAYLPNEQRFVLVANRFCWESAPDLSSKPPFYRVNCGLTVDQVTAVRSRNVAARRGEAMLDLLTLGVEDGGIMLVFAGGGEIQLETDGLRGYLEDIGEPWPTQSHPAHTGVDVASDGQSGLKDRATD